MKIKKQPTARLVLLLLLEVLEQLAVAHSHSNSLLVSSLQLSLKLSVELSSSLRVVALKNGESVLTLKELINILGDLLGVELEGVLALLDSTRIVSVERPVTGLDGLLLLLGEVAHTPLGRHTVLLARSVVEDEGRTIVGLGLSEGLDGLSHIGTNTDGGDVDVSVTHSNLAEVLLEERLTTSGELGDGTHLSGLGLLTTSVGVHLGIEDHDVDVAAGGDDVVETTVTDIVGPTITTNAPVGDLRHDVDVDGEGGELGMVVLLLVEEASGLVVELRAGLGVLLDALPLLEHRLELGRLGNAVVLEDAVDLLGELLSTDEGGEHETEAELGVILEEGGAPGGTLTLGVEAVGVGAEGTTPDSGATHSVGDHETLTEELGEELDTLGLSATGAGTGELEEGGLELGASDGVSVDEVTLVDEADGVVPVGALGVDDLSVGLHAKRLSGAGVGADLATGTVLRRDLDGELEVVDAVAAGGKGLVAGRGGSDLLVVGEEGTNTGVGAHDGALVALGAGLGIPDGDLAGNTTLLVLGGSRGLDTSGDEGGDGELVTLGVEGGVHVLDEVGSTLGPCALGIVGKSSPGLGIVDLDEVVEGLAESVDVHVNDLLTLLGVLGTDIVLEEVGDLTLRKDVGEVEEDSGHDNVDTLLETDLLGDGGGINVVELELLGGDVALHGVGEVLLELLDGVPGGVEDEGTGLSDVAEHVELSDVGGVGAGDVVGVLDEVLGGDGLGAETHVGDGETTGLVGIEDGVGLGVQRGVLGDELDGLLGGTDGTIGTVTPEDALLDVVTEGLDGGAVLEGGVAEIIVHTDGEALLGGGGLEVVVDGLGHGGGEVLATDTVLTTDDLDGAVEGVEGGGDIKVERLTGSTILTHSVEDADLLAGLGNGSLEVLDGEGTEQVHLDDTNLLALHVEVVGGLLDGGSTSTHEDDDAVGLGVAGVVEEVVETTGLAVEGGHGVLNDLGGSLVEGLVDDAVLHVDILGLGDTTLVGVVGVQAAVAELLSLGVGEDALDGVVGDGVDGVDLVGDSPAIEEVEEGDGGVDGGDVGDQGEIVGLLDGVGGEEGPAGGTGGHDIGVLAEQGEGLLGDDTGGDVEDTGKQTTGDTVHVGEHEHETLGGGEGGAEEAADEGAVEGTGSATLRLGMERASGDIPAFPGRRGCCRRCSCRRGRTRNRRVLPWWRRGRWGR